MFYTDGFKMIQDKTKDLLNTQADFLTSRTAESTRATGDAIQDILSDEFREILGPELVKEYSADFARRAMADLAFEDFDGFYYLIDVKTHRSSTVFNMPNLTSVKRLARLYEDDKNYFCLLIVSYGLQGTKVTVTDVKFVPIEFLSWDCLTIGALGWGQLQIANSNRINIIEKNGRKQWMIQMCDQLLGFYPREILKINSRIEYFQTVRQYWLSKPDD